MLLPLARLLRNRRTPLETAQRKSDTLPFRTCDGDVHSSRCALDEASRAARIVAGKEARLQLADPVPALGKRQIRVICRNGARSELIELLIVEGAEFRRQAAERPDQPELGGDEVNDKTEPRLLRERETMLGFALHLGERIARREKVRVQVVAAVGRISEVADLVRRLERAAHQIAASPDMSRPGHERAFQSSYRSWPGSASVRAVRPVHSRADRSEIRPGSRRSAARRSCQALHRRSTKRRSCRARG